MTIATCDAAAARRHRRAQRRLAARSRCPLVGAAVLLLRRPAHRPVGAPARRAACRSRCSCSACVLFTFQLRRAGPAVGRASTCSASSRSAASTSTSGCSSTRCRSSFVLLITGVGSLIHIYVDRLHGARPRPPPVLRLLQPVRRGDAAAGPRQQLRGALRRLGGRRPRVLPADLVLVHRARRRPPPARRRSS